jgi:hypothetical protein
MESVMAVFRKFTIASIAAAALAAAAATPAEAHWRGGWGLGAGAFVGGLALGSAFAKPYYPFRKPYYPHGPYGYYGGGCYFQDEVVGYTPGGRPIVRPVRVC